MRVFAFFLIKKSDTFALEVFSYDAVMLQGRRGDVTLSGKISNTKVFLLSQST